MCLNWLLLVSAVTAVLSLDTSIDLMADACGGSFNETTTTGTFTATDPGPSKNCTWIIKTNRTTPMVTLQFSVLDFTGGNDSLVIIAGDTSSKTVANFTNATVPGPVTVISPAKVTKIIFKRGSGKNMTGQFSAGFNSVNCSQSISGSQGVITSPIYLNGTGNLTCTYNVTMTGNVDVPVLSFTGNFSLPNGTLNVTFWSASQNSTTSLTGNKSQDDVFGLTGTQKFVLSLVIKNDSRAQKFSALFFTANKDCSGKYVAQDAASPLVFPLTQFPTTCHAQLAAAGVNETVYVSAGAQSDASILVYDGGSMNSSLIGDFNSGIWYGSSGQKLTLHADLGRAIRQQTSVLYWQQTDRAMYNVPRGQNITLALKTAATGPAESLSIQFLTDVYGQLRIQLNNNTKLSDNAYIQLQDGGQGNFGAPILKFTADSVLFPVVSPSNRLIVKLANVTGDNVVNLTVSAINSNMGCSHIYTARSDFVTLGYTWNKTQCNAGIMASGNMADIVTLELKSLSLCGNSTLAVYSGFNKTARLMATYNSDSPAVLRLRFPAASGARLYWSDPTGSCNKTQSNLNAFYWTQSASTACGNYGNMTNGKILSPDFPQIYPLNTLCNYTLKNVTTKYMYFTVNSIHINPNHSLVLKKNGTTDVYSFRNLSSDVMVPAGNLSLYFNATATDGPEGQLQDRGFNISVKSLDCGEVLTGANSTIKSPVKLNQSIDCIWIIQLPAKAVNKSVNIIAANISLTGLTNSSSNIFQVRDGGSMRDPVVTINSSTTQLLSRTNYLWIRFVSTVNKTANLKASNATTFSFSLNYTTHTCNSSSLCDNGFCMHDNWRCDGLNQCGDWSDEKYCNGSQPIPTTPAPPTPAPHAGGGGSSGVKGFWLVICILFGLVLGVVLAFLVPNLYRKFKFRSYSNFRESMAPSEA